MNRLLNASRCQLLLIDVQERLASVMTQMDQALANINLLVQSAQVVRVPVTISEQYPKGLGSTVPAIKDVVRDEAVVYPKMHFSCLREPALTARIDSLARPQIVICGIEAHVCVLQTAMDLLDRGYIVFVVADAIASRRHESKDIALRRLEAGGAILATAEMAAFEWLERAGTDSFKAVSRLVR